MAEAATLLPGVLRRRVRALILAVDAQEAARRAAKAAADRKVWSRPIEDSQALLIAKGPAVQIHALELRLTAEARALKKDGDPRPLDHIRFDLLCAHQTSGLTVTPLQALLHVPVATALGVSDEPGVLDGYGPLPAPLVRELLTDAELRKVCVDARTGRVVAAEHRTVPPTGSPDALRRALLTMVDTATTIDPTPEPRHDPSTTLARDVRLRDPQCDGPGCAMPAGQCELDHHIPYPDGPTSFTNLRPRSQRCHHAKHHGWTVTIDPDGTSHWTSPHRRTYTIPTRDRPPPTIPAGTRLPSPAHLTTHDHNLLTPSPDTTGDDPWAEADDITLPEEDAA
ncbi:MAG: endonuclease, partial [Frankiales bacterium]|nr:endonuclease [Frankiales bacterium]